MADRITVAALKTAIETEHLPDNDAFEIDEADFREAHNDVIDTLVSLLSLNTENYQFLNDAPGYTITAPGSYTVLTITAGSDISINLPTLDDTNLGEYRFTFLQSVEGSDQLEISFSDPSPTAITIGTLEYVILKAVKYLVQGSPEIFEYRYEEVRRGSIN